MVLNHVGKSHVVGAAGTHVDWRFVGCSLMCRLYGSEKEVALNKEEQKRWKARDV